MEEMRGPPESHSWLAIEEMGEKLRSLYHVLRRALVMTRKGWGAPRADRWWRIMDLEQVLSKEKSALHFLHMRVRILGRK